MHLLRPYMSIAAPPRLPLTFALLLVVVLFSGAVGCTNRVTPPADVADPATVFLVDYGRHAGLVLPRDDQEDHIEYAYGDWSFFAVRNTNFFNGIRVLLFPTQGALVRRAYTGDVTATGLHTYLQSEAVFALEVERDRAAALADRLAARFNEKIETMVRSDYHMHYAVHDDHRYTLLNNCNHMIARWLVDLDCDVRGPCMYSTWRIVQPGD